MKHCIIKYSKSEFFTQKNVMTFQQEQVYKEVNPVIGAPLDENVYIIQLIGESNVFHKCRFSCV